MCKQNCEKVYILNSLAKFLQMSLPKFIFIIHTVKRWKQIKSGVGRYVDLRKPISIKLRREKKIKRRYNAFLKGVTTRKGVITRSGKAFYYTFNA